MKKALLLAAGACARALPPGAQAKGPSEAKIDGPGLKAPIVLRGNGEGPGSPLGNVADLAGFFPLVFVQQPDPRLAGKPDGELGPRYEVAYTVPTGPGEADTIRQELYPYAAGGPVTYVKPGQTVFHSERTAGGWFAAMPQLKQELVAAGLPARPPTASTADDATRWWLYAAAAAGLLVLIAAVAAARRSGVTIGRWPSSRSTSTTSAPNV